MPSGAHRRRAESSKTRLLLDAAFLVARSRDRALSGGRATRWLRDLGRDGYRVEVTGPWPPYNFIEP